MIKSIATYARIHWPEEYKDYLSDKTYGYHSGKRKRLKQVIKAERKEYKFDDWLNEYDEYHKNYEWQGGDFYAETY